MSLGSLRGHCSSLQCLWGPGSLQGCPELRGWGQGGGVRTGLCAQRTVTLGRVLPFWKPCGLSWEVSSVDRTKEVVGGGYRCRSCKVLGLPASMSWDALQCFAVFGCGFLDPRLPMCPMRQTQMQTNGRRWALYPVVPPAFQCIAFTPVHMYTCVKTGPALTHEDGPCQTYSWTRL